MFASNFLAPPDSGPQPAPPTILFAYRANRLFRTVLPAVEAELRRSSALPVRSIQFDETTTPAAMGEQLSGLETLDLRQSLLVSDVSCRRGVYLRNGTEAPLAKALKEGVLLDRCLASAVKRLVESEFRAENRKLLTSTPSAQELAQMGVLTLQAERVFIETLLAPLAQQFSHVQVIIAAPRLLHHLPFISYIGALHETFMARFGREDETLPPQLLASLNGPTSILSRSRIPPAVRAKLEQVSPQPIIDPCDWLAAIVADLGWPRNQIRIVESASELAACANAENRHLQIVLGDRHLLSPERLTESLVAEGQSRELAAHHAAVVLQDGMTFRLPLEDLIFDLANVGALGDNALFTPSGIQQHLARAILEDVLAQLKRRDPLPPPPLPPPSVAI